MRNRADDFVKCLNEKRFYDAHEVLEELWFPIRFTQSNEVKLLKGFINASVSFELEKRGKIKQSDRVWKNYIKYRQLFFKIDSQHLNEYNRILRKIDSIKTTRRKD